MINGIQVMVQFFYQAVYFCFVQYCYIFVYEIIIENNSKEIVQLFGCYWFIWDVNGYVWEVEGEGVIGQQFVLLLGGKYCYVFWCDLLIGIGKMYGVFQMVNILDNSIFKVIILIFFLIVFVWLN